MRIALAGAVLLLSVTPAMAEDGDGLSQKVAQCLRDNAARVEAVEPDLAKATNYLIGDACAAPVAEEQRRLNTLRNQQTAERNRNQCRDRVAAQKARERTTPPNYSPVYEDCDLQYSNATANQATANPLEGAFLAGLLGGGFAHPPAVTSMAASLILDLRNARNRPRP